MKIGEKLMKCGMLNQDQLQLALDRHTRTGRRLGETALELGFLPERDFLTFMAEHFDTRFVTSNQLLAFTIRSEVLNLLPAKFAVDHQMVPVMTGNQGGYLGLVTPEPQNVSGVNEARILSGIEDIRVIVATRDAVGKLIQRHYKQESRDEEEVLFEIAVEDPELAATPGRPGSAGKAASKAMAMATAAAAVVAGVSESPGPAGEDEAEPETVVGPVPTRPTAPSADLIAVARTFVGIMEKNNQILPGHSLRVARTVELVSRRMNCSEVQIRDQVLAAYLHEVGKNLPPHLTLIAIKKQGASEMFVRKAASLPSGHLSELDIPESVHDILQHLYDRYDPSGVDNPPLGSRIIAVVDAYEDLVGNPENPLGRIWAPEAAMAWLNKRFAFLFDHGVLEILGQIVKEQAVKRRDPARNLPILLADPETANCYLLESALRKAGLHVIIASDSHQAMGRFIENEPAAVVIDAALEPDNGFAFLDFINRTGHQVPIVLMSADSRAETITRAFKEGVTDFIGKPAGPEVLIAKLSRAIKQKECLDAPLANSIGRLA